MQADEIAKLARLEDAHWWYRERRHLLGRLVAGIRPGTALDIGAAGGGNTRVLLERGWQAVALEQAAEGAQAAVERGVPVIRGDATRLPVVSGSLDLVLALDLLEHLDDDAACLREAHRVLRPSGSLVVTVPVDPRLWSAHDEAVGHVRRYTPRQILDLIASHGFDIKRHHAWNVLLRPVVRLRRRSSSGSDLEETPWIVNQALRAIITAERYLPVKGLPGVSEVILARRR